MATDIRMPMATRITPTTTDIPERLCMSGRITVGITDIIIRTGITTLPGIIGPIDTIEADDRLFAD
jgi:hypothetical protein